MPGRHRDVMMVGHTPGRGLSAGRKSFETCNWFPAQAEGCGLLTWSCAGTFPGPSTPLSHSWEACVLGTQCVPGLAVCQSANSLWVRGGPGAALRVSVLLSFSWETKV